MEQLDNIFYWSPNSPIPMDSYHLEHFQYIPTKDARIPNLCPNITDIHPRLQTQTTVIYHMGVGVQIQVFIYTASRVELGVRIQAK